jgi:branched-chain amino acid transport system ATP-binding protein
MTAPCLALDHVSRHFGGLKAVDDVTLTVQPGERHALIGPNGAGKTTLFNVISGELAPHRRAALGIARTFQITKLFANLTVMENLLLACEALEGRKLVVHRGVSSYADLTARAGALIDQFGLTGRSHDYARNLSHGEQRKLEVALSMAGRPRLLLLDEPSLGIAPILVQEIFGEIARINREDGTAILLVEQNAHAALGIAHRAYVLETGSIVLEGPARELKDHPQVKEAYLG